MSHKGLLHHSAQVLCDAAKAHRARIQDLEQELTRCTADFQTSQLQRAALQEQVRELEVPG